VPGDGIAVAARQARRPTSTHARKDLLMNIELGGKRAVVTGGSRGIGRAIALAFAEAGADVSICARGAEALAKTRAELAQFGHAAHAAVCDLADGAALARISQRVGASGPCI
jgi:3-oxoacyl-[acyl-carrier protein] reductase